MNHKHGWLRGLTLLPLLLIVTLLFLEIPKFYYRYQDRQILKESGQAKYESRETKSKESWGERAKEFFSCKTTRMEHLAERDDEYLYDDTLEVVKELSLLLGGECKSILEEMLLEYKETSGYIMMFTYDDTAWEIGLWEFSLPTIGTSGTILYDMDSYKIFWVELLTYESDDENPIKTLDESNVFGYYKGVVSEEMTFINEPEYILISPFSQEAVYEKILDKISVYLPLPAREVEFENKE